jgi:MoaA/NifB/PqqE/SkfB family radical SAM enzyme
MNLPHNKFCVLPWISLETSPIGTVRPCCLYDGEVQNSQSVKFDLNKDNLKDIQNSEYMHQLRGKFLQDEKPAECRRCWAEEDANRTSKRMHTLDRLKDILKDETEWTVEPKPLMFLDLKLGNICNIACRICGSWSSSTYAGEEIKELPFEKRKESFAYQMNRRGNWPRKSLTFWEDLEAQAPHIRYIEFTGGEPFMIQEHFDFLQYLINNDYSRNIEIHYNTNTTLYPDDDAIWKPFKHVEVAFSIDDLRERFEYQRYGASWKTLNKNLERFKKLRERSNNISLQVCSTVNVFNVMYLEELANWIDSQGFDFVYWNMLHDAPQHCITSLPKAAKLRATERLLSATVSEKHRKEFKNIAFFMNSRDTDPNLLIEDSVRMDKRRNQSMHDYLPELAECLHGKT